MKYSICILALALTGLATIGSTVWADQRYTIRYELRQGNKNASNTKTVTATTERIAIEIVKSIAKSERPGYAFILKGVTSHQAQKTPSYTIHYKMQQGSRSVSDSKTVKAENERTAVSIVKSIAESEQPGYNFILKNSTIDK